MQMCVKLCNIHKYEASIQRDVKGSYGLNRQLTKITHFLKILILKKRLRTLGPGTVAHTRNPSTLGGQGRQIT